MSRQPTQDDTSKVLVFPDDDLAFHAHVDAALRRRPQGAAAFEQYLYDAYPEARVRERSGLADLGGEHAWYVYRDGTALTSRDEDWWSSPYLPAFEIDPAGTYTAGNAAAADLLGRDVRSIIGSRIGSFTRHEATDDAGLQAFAVLAEKGVLESTAVVVRPDGTEIRVRYRLTGNPAVGYHMVMRPI